LRSSKLPSVSLRVSKYRSKFGVLSFSAGTRQIARVFGSAWDPPASLICRVMMSPRCPHGKQNCHEKPLAMLRAFLLVESGSLSRQAFSQQLSNVWLVLR
jgi:hypothetical protein